MILMTLMVILMVFYLFDDLIFFDDFDDDIHHNLPQIVQRIGEQRWLPPRFGFQFIIVTNCSIIITVVIAVTWSLWCCDWLCCDVVEVVV